MGAFKLGKMTFGSLFKKPETVQYPIEKKPQPAGLKGRIVIDVDTCILCGMCERSCTTNCISVNRNERYWQIQPYQCIQCGYCTTVCPKQCLSMNPNYTPAATEKTPTRAIIPERQKPAPQEIATEEKTQQLPAVDAIPEEKAVELSSPALSDPQVEALMSLMGQDKAKAVKAALRV